MYKSIVTIIFLFAFFFLFGTIFRINAQVDSSGYSIVVPVNGDLENGDILCTYPNGIQRCNQEYDPSILGVYIVKPGVLINDSDIQNGKPVSKEGITKVRVRGPLSEGDLVTTSTDPGVGQKASANGYVLGISLDKIETNEIQTIQILVNIHPATTLAGARGNLIQFIRKGISVPVFQPLESLRYLLAVLIVIISFTLGLIYFGRASRTGIEAIGRNPLAKRVIQLTIILNILLTLVIVLAGLAIAYMILIL
jgi:hypothetical protein